MVSIYWTDRRAACTQPSSDRLPPLLFISWSQSTFAGSASDKIRFLLPSAVAGAFLYVEELHMRGETGALPSGPFHTLFKRVMIALAPLSDRWWAGRMNFSSGLGCGRGQGLSFRSNIKHGAPRWRPN